MADESVDPVPVEVQGEPGNEALQDPPQDAPEHAEDRPGGARRNFFWELTAVVAGAIVGVVPMLVGLYTFLLTPFRKKQLPLNYETGTGEGAGANEYFVAPLDAIPADGMPRRFEIVADRVDAWNFIPHRPIGAIFLSRQQGDGPSPQVVAFHATCPHAGCTVAFSVDSDAFLCPCHNSSFSKDGEKMDLAGRSNPSPRGLDKLQVNQEKLSSDGEVWVEYVNYYTGRKEMKPKA